MLITCVILMMIDVVIHGQGRVTWRTRDKLVLYFNVFGLRSPGALWRKRAKYLQTHIQVVLIAANPHWKMLLSGIFGTNWVANAWKPWKPCIPWKAIKALYALYAKYANVLVEKRTPVEKSKIWNQTAYTLCSLFNNTTTVRLKNKTLIDANCMRNKRLNTGMAPTCDWMIKMVKVNNLYLNSLLVSMVNRVSRSGTMKYQCENTDEYG